MQPLAHVGQVWFFSEKESCVMATKWVGNIPCRWCPDRTKVGIEKDGLGSTYRVMCSSCGIMIQVGFNYPAGQQITKELRSAGRL